MQAKSRLIGLLLLVPLAIWCGYLALSPKSLHVVGDQSAGAHGAIAVAVGDLRQSGGDPFQAEWSASPTDNGAWMVTAWHIRYPYNTGGSRFVPGGYTTYEVGQNGKLLNVRGGL